MCFEKEMEYLDSLAILLLALSLLGILFVLAIGIIFTRNLNTPVVKSSGELMVYYVILFCHFLNFAGTGFFIREPQSFTCKTRQTLILHELYSLHLLHSDEVPENSAGLQLSKLQNFLKCFYKPIPIIFTCTGI